ncbi:hypothetical protein [Streptomyces sp. 6N223]|uniref:hypothetical protein n=1 Tax=Streptomyces sp. 6N223 TaxID=3457412 RepID=UPI003FD1BDE2
MTASSRITRRTAQPTLAGAAALGAFGGDFNAAMDFADRHLQGAQPTRDFNGIPHPEDPAAIPWTFPS